MRRGRREERVPQAALGDVHGLEADGEGRVVVEEGEEVDKDEGEALGCEDKEVGEGEGRRCQPGPRGLHGGALAAEKRTHEERNGVGRHGLWESEHELVPERVEDVLLRGGWINPVSSCALYVLSTSPSCPSLLTSGAAKSSWRRTEVRERSVDE